MKILKETRNADEVVVLITTESTGTYYLKQNGLYHFLLRSSDVPDNSELLHERVYFERGRKLTIAQALGKHAIKDLPDNFDKVFNRLRKLIKTSIVVPQDVGSEDRDGQLLFYTVVDWCGVDHSHTSERIYKEDVIRQARINGRFATGTEVISIYEEGEQPLYSGHYYIDEWGVKRAEVEIKYAKKKYNGLYKEFIKSLP